MPHSPNAFDETTSTHYNTPLPEPSHYEIEVAAKAIMTAHLRGKNECTLCFSSNRSLGMARHLRNKGYNVAFTYKYPTKTVNGLRKPDYTKDLLEVTW